MRAQPEPESDRCADARHVSIAFDSGFDAALQSEVLKDLQSELATRRLSVCMASESTQGEALADVHLEGRSDARIAIEVFDRTTDKRVGRDLDLSRISNNGRALAVAIAVDELLRASWAELALRSERSERTEPVTVAPVESKEPVVTVMPKQTVKPLSYGVEGTYVHSFDRYDAFGAAGVVDLVLSRSVWLEARAGFSSAMKRKVPEGTVTVRGANVGMTLGACWSREARLSRMCLGARTVLDLLTFTGESVSSAEGNSALKPVVTTALVGQLRVRLVRALSLVFSAGAGTPLLGARMSSGSRTLSRIDGLLLQSSLGLVVTP